jgi:hypothetical protein
MLPSSLMIVAAAAVFLTGCAVKPQPAQPRAACDDAKPHHIVIGISARNVPDATRRSILQAVLQQLTTRIQPGSDGVVVSAYPLGDDSVASQPVRATTPCIPPVPTPPDLPQTPTFQRASLLEAYRDAQARSRAEVERARSELDYFSGQLLALEPPPTPTDIWGFLSVAADEFSKLDSDQRDVIIVARDEEVQSTYCDGCHDLQGAAVHFLAFDQPTPSDERRRRSDWSMWLSRVGASSITFSRSNEPLPALFADQRTTPSSTTIR